MTFNEKNINRDTAGRFDEKPQSAAEARLPQTSAATSDVTLDTPEEHARKAALSSLEDIFADNPDALTAAREHMSRTCWRPDLYFISRSDSLDTTLGAFLEGDDEKVDDLLCAIEDNNWDSINDSCRDILGGEVWDELDEDTKTEVRDWARDWDTSTPIADMVRDTPKQLMQVQLGDDDAFDDALQTAFALPEGSQERYGAIEGAFMSVLTGAGAEDSDANRDAVRCIIDENDLSAGYHAREQWKLRVLVYDDIDEYARSGWSKNGRADRDITLTDVHLVLIDPWNGRGSDAKLSGPVTARVTEERPARLDSDAPGWGSWDKVCGLHKPAFAPSTAITSVLEDVRS